jgi:rsbT co-antagonist protein RsbR
MNDQSLDPAALRAEMNLNRYEVGQRKAWLGFDDKDFVRLARINDLVKAHVGTIIDALVEELLVDGDSSSRNNEQAQKLLHDYFGGLTSSDGFNDSFIDGRLVIVNALQEQVSPDVSWYLAAYLFYLNEVATLVRVASGDLEEMQAAYRTLAKVVFLDLSLAIDTHVFDRNRTIRAQQRELEELSTPVLQLREGLLILPIVGLLDSRRAQQLTEQLLKAIRDRRGKVVVLDVTGVAAVDSRVANHLIQTVDAARLMGAKAIVTGVSPEVAQTLVGLGISLGNVTTVAELQGGVDEADRMLGLRVVAVDELSGDGDRS